MKRRMFFLFASVILLVTTNLWAGMYYVTDLGTLGGNYSMAYSINNNGQIVGLADDSFGNRRATIFQPGGANIDLGTLGGADSVARSINNNGQVVGHAQNSSGEIHATLFQTDGTNIDLGTIGGIYSSAYSINDNGEIVGLDFTSPGQTHATLFQLSGVVIDLGTLGGYSSRANSINNNGVIVGQSDTATSGQRHATIFNLTGANIDLGSLDGYTSSALSINNNGQIVGESENLLGDPRACIFDPSGGITELGTIGGSPPRSYATSINNNGVIVGYSISDTGSHPGPHATLFDSTGSGNNIDLNTMIDPALDWTLKYATDINDNGWIIGRGYNPQGYEHAFLLTPTDVEVIPTPSAVILGSLGLGISGWVLKKRKMV